MPRVHQQRRIETLTCTQHGTNNAIETLERRLFNLPSDYSERLVAIGSGNTETGNDPHKVAEWIRHNGLVDEKVLPFDDSIETWEQYFSPNPLTNELSNKAKLWLKNREFKHEWVFQGGSIQNKQKMLLEALQYSPIGVSVDAWKRNDDGLYVKTPGDRDNHWTIIVRGEKKKPWKVLDSYYDDDFIKELDWNYDFNFAKLYVLNYVEKKECWLKNYFKQLWL